MPIAGYGGRTVNVWVTIVNAAKMVPCGVADGDGAIEVSLIEADMMLDDGAKQESGWFKDVSPALRKLIEEEYDKNTSGDFWGKKNLRIKEQVLAVGDKCLVVGKVKLKTAPRGALALAQRRPSCASMIVRQMESPMPSPVSLLVWKGWKTSSSASGAIPGPVSQTETCSSPDGFK